MLVLIYCETDNLFVKDRIFCINTTRGINECILFFYELGTNLNKFLNLSCIYLNYFIVVKR